MENYLKSKGSFIKFNKRVTAIQEGFTTISSKSCSTNEVAASFKGRLSDSVGRPQGVSETCTTVERTLPSVGVTVNGSDTPEVYAHVISTLPLTVLRTINLNHAGLNVLQKNALRALDYGPSIKIAILFKSNWWTTKLGIVGGQSYTDLPIRTIVYPSYGVDSNTPSKVLIASYSWTNDASRLGALALKDEKEVLKELVLRNLEETHKHFNYEITYEYLLSEYDDMHVKDWNIDEYSMGPSSIPPLYSTDFFFDQAHSQTSRLASSRICMLHSTLQQQTVACTLRVRL